MGSECKDQMLNMMSCSLNSSFVSPTTEAHEECYFQQQPSNPLVCQHSDLITLTANQHSHISAAKLGIKDTPLAVIVFYQ